MSRPPRRILIVDASLDARNMCKRLLSNDSSAAYVFSECGSGADGLAVCLKEKPDCVLLDYDLPDLNGLEFMRRLERQSSDAPIAVIVLGSHGNDAIAAEVIKSGAQDYLIKQSAGSDLCVAVRAAIDRVALRRQLKEHREEVQRLAEERTALVAKLEQQAAELREAGRRKGAFLAVLAHELRNPLGPIRNAAKILSLDPVTEYGHDQARDVIERQVAHMSCLIDELLDVSRIASGKMLLHRERIDLAALAGAVANDRRPAIEAAGLKFMLDLPNSPAWIDGDSTRMAQVMGNVLSNACKFTGADGSVTLTLYCTDEDAVVVISDTGIGMDPQTLAHAFDPAQPGETNMDHSRGGLGLGLAISKGFVELHGGHAVAESKGRGKGCRITLTIPLSHAPARTNLASSPAPATSASWRVLVIEDNIDAAKTLASLLRLFGHKSFVAHSGPEGVQSARELHPDVILCDIGLPGEMDGYGVAQTIRGDLQIPSAYMIAVTGYGREDDMQLAEEAGFNLHLTKPVDPNRLDQLLKRLKLPEDANSFRTLQTTS